MRLKWTHISDSNWTQTLWVSAQWSPVIRVFNEIYVKYITRPQSDWAHTKTPIKFGTYEIALLKLLKFDRIGFWNICYPFVISIIGLTCEFRLFSARLQMALGLFSWHFVKQYRSIVVSDSKCWLTRFTNHLMAPFSVICLMHVAWKNPKFFLGMLYTAFAVRVSLPCWKPWVWSFVTRFPNPFF